MPAAASSRCAVPDAVADGWVEFKDEDQDEDGMPIGPAWVVEADGTRALVGDGSNPVCWFRKSHVIEWAGERALEVREV